jgi:hypothetical protein
MTISEPISTHADNGDRYRTTAVTPDIEERETKPSPLTTEFWAMVIGAVALIVIYNMTDDRSLTLFRTSLLATILAVGYMVSRGLAKSGSTDTRQPAPRRHG